MTAASDQLSGLTFKPLTGQTFPDLDQLFSMKGCSFARGCWCIEYRVRGKIKPPDGVGANDHKRALLRKLASDDIAPGLIAYDQTSAPVGWVTLGPRETFARVQASRVMKPVDDTPTWCIVCFVVPSPYRGTGVAHRLLHAAVDYAREHGAKAVEGYPLDKAERTQAQWLWHGTASMFAKAGFQEIARRSEQRPVMRLTLDA
ncbi:MAG: GNAT family N-acetyltransferase [Pseudomonadota bacterium]